jgi:hypothetical protein
MATNTRTHGANARQIDWSDRDRRERRDYEQAPGWMPLDDLDDDEMVYAGTPRLQAMAPPAAPTRRHPVQPTRAQEQIAPTRQHRTQAQEHPQAGPLNLKVVQARTVAMIAGLCLAALSFYVLLSMAIEWTQVKLDDFQYGRPRTMQMDAYVGHNETEGVPSHFVAMNLNRRVTIMQMPGGDSTKVNTIVGPYLFGQGQDLTPVTMAAQDLNGDKMADLIVSVKSEQLLYLNDGTTFRLATPEERSAIEQSLKAKAVQPKVDQQSAAQQGGAAPEVGR